MLSSKSLSVALAALLACTAVFAAEGRIPVYQAGTIITAPGRYIVTQNLNGSGAAPVIDIAAYDVELDLNGFILNNGAGPAPVIRASLVRRVTIRNGTVAGGGTGLELGEYQMVVENMTVYNSAGYGISITNGGNHVIRNVAIDVTGSDAVYLYDTTTLVESVRIRYATGHGIHVKQGNGTTVTNCSINLVVLHGIWFEGSSASAAVNNQIGVSGVGIRLDAIGLGGRIWDNRVGATSHAIHASGGSGASIMRNAVRSNSGHGIYVQAVHTVIEGNQADGCWGFGLYLTAGSSNFSTYGRNAMQENQGFLPACAVGPANPNFCNESSSSESFGDNLMPGLQ